MELMKKDNMPQVAKFWNEIASDFDAIYSGKKGPLGRFLDRVLRKKFKLGPPPKQ